MRVISFGGGVQSTALLVLAAQGVLGDIDAVLFANVGDDSEHPKTLDYVRGPAWDYAAQHGVELHELHRVPQRGISKGEVETLWGRLMREGSRSLPIPVRMPDTGAPGTRNCTADFKIRVVQRWLQEAGADEAHQVRVQIGISTDEYERASSRKRDVPWEIPTYPLLHLEHRLARPRGGLDRSACAQIIRDAGLPVPPKSSCFFCPFHKPTVWADQARDEPELFARSVLLEDTLNERRAELDCPGEGRFPAEAMTPAGDEEGEVDTYRPGWTPAAGQGACPSCRSRQPVELDAKGRWVMAGHRRGPVYLTRFGKPLRSLFGSAETGGPGIQGSLLAPGWDEDEGYRCGDVCDT